MMMGSASINQSKMPSYGNSPLTFECQENAE
ncbi:hypothetical protein JOH51_000623 [Rhizobium leguminosarum]|nr:hypothetical protein [Rhizobium leguminosarum]